MESENIKSMIDGNTGSVKKKESFKISIWELQFG